MELPHRASAHRTFRQLVVNGDAVTALRAMVGTCRLRAGRDEVDIVVRGGALALHTAALQTALRPAALNTAAFDTVVQHTTLPFGPSDADRIDPHNRTVETPDFFELDPPAPGPAGPAGYARTAPSGGLWGAGERITWISGLILALSAFMDWY